MGRNFVWVAMLALVAGSAAPVGAQSRGNERRQSEQRREHGRERDTRVYRGERDEGDEDEDDDRNDDRVYRNGDRVYRDRDGQRVSELCNPGRNGRGAENGRGKKIGLRKNCDRNSDWNTNRNTDRYPDRNSDGYPDRGSDRNSDLGTYRTLNVDRQYYPQNGQCRLWFADRPARYQMPALNCDRLYGHVPAKSFILYEYRAWDGDFDWYRYDQRYPGRVPRVIVDISQSMRSRVY